MQSFWEKSNAAVTPTKYAPDWNDSRLVGSIVKPTGWDAFTKQGGDQSTNKAAYQSWARGMQRENQQSDYVDRMAGGDTGLSDYSAKMGGDYDKYKGNLDTYLAQRGPQMETGNRFEAGLAGNERRLNALLDDPESIRQTAAYKFRVGQGQEALQRQMAAKGMLGSGNRLMELTKYGQDMGSQEYDAQANRLSGLVGTYGQNWLGNKNANVQKYNVDKTAWGQRGNTLANLLGTASGAEANATKVNADNRLGWANAWTAQAGKPLQTYDNGTMRSLSWG